jgi:hypothetical protein
MHQDIREGSTAEPEAPPREETPATLILIEAEDGDACAVDGTGC